MRNPAETREKLLRTAMSLICQSSYHQVGVNEICRQAEVTKGAFYHHFDSKADLYHEAAQLHWDETKPDFDRISSPDYTPLQQLQNLVDMVVECHTLPQDDDEIVGCSIISTGYQEGDHGNVVAAFSQKITEEILKYHNLMVENLVKADMLASDPDIEQVGRLIHHYIHGLVDYGRVFNDHSGMRADLTEAVCRLVDLKPEFRRMLLSPSVKLASAL